MPTVRSLLLFGPLKRIYVDEYTQEDLPINDVKTAIVDELSYFNSDVWELLDIDEMRTEKGSKLLNGRWVFSNKGDLAQPDVRARYVACEIKTYDDAACFCGNSTVGGQATALLTVGNRADS